MNLFHLSVEFVRIEKICRVVQGVKTGLEGKQGLRVSATDPGLLQALGVVPRSIGDLQFWKKFLDELDCSGTMEREDPEPIAVILDLCFFRNEVLIELTFGDLPEGRIQFEEQLLRPGMDEGGKEDLSMTVQEAGRPSLPWRNPLDIMAQQIVQKRVAIFALNTQDASRECFKNPYRAPYVCDLWGFSFHGEVL